MCKILEGHRQYDLSKLKLIVVGVFEFESQAQTGTALRTSSCGHLRLCWFPWHLKFKCNTGTFKRYSIVLVITSCWYILVKDLLSGPHPKADRRQKTRDWPNFIGKCKKQITKSMRTATSKLNVQVLLSNMVVMKIILQTATKVTQERWLLWSPLIKSGCRSDSHRWKLHEKGLTTPPGERAKESMRQNTNDTGPWHSCFCEQSLTHDLSMCKKLNISIGQNRFYRRISKQPVSSHFPCTHDSPH